ncbi:RING-H2 finger protein ATL80 [Apostasia shenzhenica]|uniref:RING-H2 finger protein ATL80 n=1 Tax=Apostasia shenzhenica TaxID=1088818 RepID=A0A2H9ZXU4_9ASPA|nr:RING-H2 finger protein ATL80 [Apostasia shenzhenica]
MPPSARILQSSSDTSAALSSHEPKALESNVVVILAALLCALICAVGLALAARCSWLRRTAAGGFAEPPPPNKGLKKKALRSLPTASFDSAVAAGGRLAECPICLTEFAHGDQIRILPQCGHGFHVICVDTWLRSHSSCPSCRQILAVPAPSRCYRCGSSSASEGTSSDVVTEEEVRARAREDGDANRFLP